MTRAAILSTHGARIARMYANGSMRIEGQRAMVRLYERFGTNKVTLGAMRETLRRMVAREFSRTRAQAA